MFFPYNSGDLVYIISPLTSQLQTTSRKIMIKYVGPVVIYKIIDPDRYIICVDYTQRLKPAMIRTSEGNVTHLAKLKQIINTGIVLTLKMKISI